MNEPVIDWVDAFADQNNADKSDVVNRAIKVYAAKLASGEWSDPKFNDSVDKKFGRI